MMVPLASSTRWILVGDEKQLPPFVEMELRHPDILERFDLAPDRAFAVLSRLSQDLGRKVRDVAQELVVTRTMPGG